MALRVPLRLLACSALIITAASLVAWATPATQTVSALPAAPDGGDLEEVMHDLEKQFEAVIAAIEKKEAKTALDLMTKVQTICIAAKTMTPPKIRIIPEADKAAFVAGYRKQMMVLLKSAADLEISLIDGDLEKAKKLTEEMDAMQKTGHDAYKKMPKKS